MKKWLILPAFSLFISLCFGQDRPQPSRNSKVNYHVDTARPADRIDAQYPYDIPLRNAQGDTLNTSDVLAGNGKPTILMFWLTTCAPCRAELKAVSGKYEQWQTEADFNLYAISIDFPHNFEQFVKKVETGNWPFPAYFDLDREFRLILPGNLNGLPQTFILDGNGQIVHHKRKYRPGDEDELFELVKKMR